MKHSALAALVALFMLAGCTVAPEASTSTSNASSTKSGKKKAKTPAVEEDETTASDANTPADESDAADETPAAEPEALAGPDETYVATKTTTEPYNQSGFALSNGGGDCTALVFSNVNVKANVDADGKVKTFSFSATWTESKPNTCTGIETQPSGTVQYTFTAPTPTDAAFKVESTGTVKATAIATVGVHDGAGRVTINFKRTDQGEKGWVFTSQFPLKKQ